MIFVNLLLQKYDKIYFGFTATRKFIFRHTASHQGMSTSHWGLTMINGTQLYNGSLCAVGMAALKKYKERGFKFISCPAAHRYAFACKSDNRSLTDGGCLWVDVNCVPRAGRRPHQIFEKLGIFNVNWALGGLLCGVPAAFVQPYTRVTGESRQSLSRTHH